MCGGYALDAFATISEGSTMRTYYHTCPDCGANLDPGEKCDCQTVKNNITKEANTNVRAENYHCRP